jgi:hypothetical protein
VAPPPDRFNPGTEGVTGVIGDGETAGIIISPNIPVLYIVNLKKNLPQILVQI